MSNKKVTQYYVISRCVFLDLLRRASTTSGSSKTGGSRGQKLRVQI